MADVLTPAQRRYNMSQIRSKDTKPELVVRRTLFAMGYRYRLHVRSLRGTPDIVFSGRRKIIFVHGCFWHGHQGCRFAARPSTRAEFWRKKIEAAQKRDAEAQQTLAQAGWDVLVVWECEVGDHQNLRKRLSALLDPVPQVEECSAKIS